MADRVQGPAAIQRHDERSCPVRASEEHLDNLAIVKAEKRRKEERQEQLIRLQRAEVRASGPGG